MEKSEYKPVEIILVDNASIDGTVEVVRQTHSQVQILALKENLGLTGGRNAGQNVAKGSYLLFLDSDTTVESRAIGELVRFCKGRVSVTCPKICSYAEPTRVWYAGATFNLMTSRASNIGDLEVDVGQFDAIRRTSHGPTCFMVQKVIADEIGGHDQEFVMSYGDADFALRVWESGYEALYVPTAKIYHKIPSYEKRNSLRNLGFAFPKRAYYYSRNKVIFMRRHARSPNFLSFLLIFAPLINIGYTVEIIRRRGGVRYLGQYWRGVAEAMVWLVRDSISNSSMLRSPKYQPKTKIKVTVIPPR